MKIKIISYGIVIEEKYDVNDVSSIFIESGEDILDAMEDGVKYVPNRTKICNTESYLCVRNVRDAQIDVFSSDCYAKIDW